MDARTRREPEPIEIELVSLDAPGAGSGGRRDRPPPGGAGSLPSTAAIVHRALGRLREAPDPRLGPDQHQRAPWADLGVHRLVGLDAGTTISATVALLGPPATSGASPSRPALARLGPLGRLRLRGPIVEPGTAGAWAGALRVHQRGRATPIELIVEPWSDDATELRLRARARRAHPHPPRRFFDIAHLVMDELTTLVEARSAAHPTDARRRP